MPCHHTPLVSSSTCSGIEPFMDISDTDFLLVQFSSSHSSNSFKALKEPVGLDQWPACLASSFLHPTLDSRGNGHWSLCQQLSDGDRRHLTCIKTLTAAAWKCNRKITRSTRTVHTSVKACLTSVTIRIRIHITTNI